MKKSKKQSTSKRRGLFLPFFLLSIGLHLIGFSCIQKYSLWFYSPIKEHVIRNTAQVLHKRQREKTLYRFTHNLARKKTLKKSFENTPINEPFSLFFSLPDLEKKYAPTEAKLPEPSQFVCILEEDDLSRDLSGHIFATENKTNLHNLKIRAYPPLSPLESSEKETNYFVHKENSPPFKLSPIFSYNEEKEIIEQDFFSYLTSRSIENIVQMPIEAPKKDVDLTSRSKTPSLHDLQTALYGDDFSMELVQVSSGKEGYIFAITLIPRDSIDLPRISQQYTFLLDRSNGVQKERLKATRDALYHALSFLDPEDTFNIVAFDNKMEKLFPSHTKVSEQNKKSARKFLINLQLGSFFAAPNIYNPLYFSLNAHNTHNPLQSIILLSNGEGLIHKGMQHLFMGKWTEFNAGRSSLFSLAMNEDKRLADLELISSLNRGWLLTSSTKGGLRRKVQKLMKTIQKPIIKDVTCSYIPKPGNQIELFHPAKGLSHLYVNEPYVIIGRCQKLEDFTLVLQGKNKDTWINIKKIIPLTSAEKGENALKEQWALHQAWMCYDSYLKDKNAKYLEKARSILAPFNIPPLFK